MAMKELFFENDRPLQIKNAVNQAKHRAHNAVIRNQGTDAVNKADEAIPNAVVQRHSVTAKKLTKIS